MKLVALYKQPADPADFDEKYFGTHVPLVEKVPGLRKNVVSRIERTIAGEGFYLIAELHFDDKDALKAAMKSPEMAAAGENLQSFAGDLVTMMYAREAAPGAD